MQLIRDQSNFWKWLLLGVMIVSLNACTTDTAAEPTPTPASGYSPVSQPSSGSLTANGVLQPIRQVTLSLGVGGRIESVDVALGDPVQIGQALAQLDTAEMERAVRQAEATLTAAQARLTLLENGPSPEEVAIAEAQLEAAQAALAKAVAQRNQLSGTGIAEAQAQLAAAKIAETAARDAHHQVGGLLVYMNLQASEATRLAAELQLAELEEGGAQRQAADAAVWAASAQRDIAQTQLDRLEAGATAEELAAAEAEVVNATAALETAQDDLARATLLAPFSGVVSAVQVRAGEWIAPTTDVIALVDLSGWRIETKNVGELEIGQVEIGQQVRVWVNAFRNEELAGQVVAISPVAVVQQGDTTYTLIIELEPTTLNLWPGMTARVEISLE